MISTFLCAGKSKSFGQMTLCILNYWIRALLGFRFLNLLIPFKSSLNFFSFFFFLSVNRLSGHTFFHHIGIQINLSSCFNFFLDQINISTVIKINSMKIKKTNLKNFSLKPILVEIICQRWTVLWACCEWISTLWINQIDSFYKLS